MTIFIRNPHGSEHIQAKASAFGMIFGETEGTRKAPAQPGFIGNTFAYKDALKAAGARWNAEHKAWVFETWGAAEAALDSIK